MTIRDWLQQHGWGFTEANGTYRVTRCPYCGDEKGHFYVYDESGVALFKCHKCGRKGGLKEFEDPVQKKRREPIHVDPAFAPKTGKEPRQDLADTYHAALLADPDGLAFLAARKITVETAKKYRIGILARGAEKWISYPHFEGARLVNIKFRTIPPATKAFQRLPGCRSVMLNADVLHTQTDEIILTEGEIDAYTLLQAGFENVIGLTGGAGTLDPEWVKQLDNVRTIFLAYDADKAGEDGARAAAKRLGWHRCFRVDMPDGQDVSEYFMSHGKEEFQKLLNSARRYHLPTVVTAEQATEQLIRMIQGEDDSKLIRTPWESINRIVKGFSGGDLIIVSAPGKIGKTSFCLQICLDQALRGNAVFVFCLEMKPARLQEKLIKCYAHADEVTAQLVDQTSSTLSKLPIYYNHDFRPGTLAEVIATIKDAIRYYDLRLVVFDNLHFLVRSVDKTNEEVSRATREFKLLAEEMGVPIILIAQPRKRGMDARDEIIGADDVKYSSSVHQDCDMMILLHRKKKKRKLEDLETGPDNDAAFHSITHVRVEAHRYGPGGDALLYFHGAQGRYETYRKGEEN